MSNNTKKDLQLGINHSTANARLKKNLLFSLVKQLNQNYCFQCSAEITTAEELSIEHKLPYLDSEDPKKLFFDLDNIAFSHLKCNVEARRIPPRSHGISGYKRGCRCIICKQAKSKEHKRAKK